MRPASSASRRPSSNCRQAGAKVILLAHFGRPKGGPSAEFSLQPVAAATAGIIGRPVAFASDCIGRRRPSAPSRRCRRATSCFWKTPAFTRARRRTIPPSRERSPPMATFTSTTPFPPRTAPMPRPKGIAHLLPAFAGRAMQAELDALEKGLGNPARPVVAIVGGAKVSSKLDLLMNLVRKVDALVIGGGMANTFLAARGDDVGKSLCEHDLADTARQIMIEAADRRLRRRAALRRRASPGSSRPARHRDRRRSSGVPADAMILDVGPKTAGGRHRVDRPRRDAGLERPARRLRDRAVRQGDGCRGASCGRGAPRRASWSRSPAAATRSRPSTMPASADDFTYVSTAGGAFLEWMEGKALPGVEVLKASRQLKTGERACGSARRCCSQSI